MTELQRLVGKLTCDNCCGAGKLTSFVNYINAGSSVSIESCRTCEGTGVYIFALDQYEALGLEVKAAAAMQLSPMETGRLIAKAFGNILQEPR